MRMQPTVSLLVVNYQSASLTEQLVREVGDGVDEVIVIDSGSPSDGVRLDQFEREHPDAQVVRLSQNVGYGTAANEGARRASGDVLVVANSDVVASAAAVRELSRIVCSERIAVVAPRFVGTDGVLERSAHRRDIGLLSTVHAFCGPFAHLAQKIAPHWHPSLYPPEDHDRQLECVHVLGALMAIDAEMFRAVGGFDESFFLYREETDLCIRIRAAGGRVVHAGTVVARHIGGGSTKSSWPYQGNTHSLTSHYQYLRKHRGRARTALLRAAGTCSCAVWLAAGPPEKRPLALRALRWHLGMPVPP